MSGPFRHDVKRTSEVTSVGDFPRRLKGEISYDLIMEEEMDFVEGTYRIEGKEWEVFIFEGPTLDVDREPQCWRQKWDSGVTGIVFRLPKNYLLDKEMVRVMMSKALGVENWRKVKGPDSMVLR